MKWAIRIEVKTAKPSRVKSHHRGQGFDDEALRDGAVLALVNELPQLGPEVH